MMQFENINFLWLLAVIPLLVALFVLNLAWRRKAVRKLGDEHLVNRLMERYSSRRRVWKLIVLLLALAALVTGLANLRSGSKKEIAKGESSEIIICFDVSTSMLAEDVKPDRLTQAKLIATQLIERLAGNRFGLIVFAGNSFVQMPLTSDTRAALMYVNIINTDLIPTQGTAIGEALRTALIEFDEASERPNTGKAILLITDGESHDANAMEVAEQAAKDGIKIFNIGVGTKNGGPIPVKRAGTTQGFKQDKEGNIVLTRLNENMLEQIASETDGFYINASAGRQVISRVEDAVELLDKTGSEAFEYAEYANHFQVFLAFGLFLMTLEFFMSDKRPLWLERIKLFRQKNKTE